MNRPTTVLPRSITFPDGSSALSISPEPGATAPKIIEALGIKTPTMLTILLGGADKLEETQKSQLSVLVSRGIARACALPGALILDGGTQSGIMEMIGKGVVAEGNKSVLLGVAPRGKVTFPGAPKAGSIEDRAELDAHHTHFVLAHGDAWGDEIDTMFAVAAELGQGIPVLAVLVNGGEGAKQEVLQVVRHGWPLVVLEGSGRLADDIAREKQAEKPTTKDAALAEIVAQGNITLFPIKDTPEALVRLLQNFDQYALLKQMWQRFATFDLNAGKQQKVYRRLRAWLLRLGLLSTTLVVVQQALVLQKWFPVPDLVDQIFRYLILSTPIMITILFAWMSHFHVGASWIALRAGAESIKAEIYSYRMRAREYALKSAASASESALVGAADTSQVPAITPERLLSYRVSKIENKVGESGANITELTEYTGSLPPKMYGAEARDDGLSHLTPERYLAIRLGDQINYYEMKTAKFGRQLRQYQWLIYIVGGVGTLLAAFNLELFVALTTAMVATITSYLESDQTESTLKKYNQAKIKLRQVQGWWGALSHQERILQESIDQLVAETESALQSEHAGWVLQMREAISQFHPAGQDSESVRAIRPSEGE